VVFEDRCGLREYAAQPIVEGYCKLIRLALASGKFCGRDELEARVQRILDLTPERRGETSLTPQWGSPIE
jgi:hypothetical protein